MLATDWGQLSQPLQGRAELRILGLFLQAAHREGLLPQDGFQSREGTLSWRSQNRTLEVEGQEHALGNRLTITSSPWLCDGDIRTKLDLETTVEVVGSFSRQGRDASWSQLAAELREGVGTQAAAYAVSLKKAEPQSWADYENWTPEGHNLHPGAKTRTGFSISDQLSFAPEFASSLELPWIAVDKELLQTSGVVPELFDSGSEWVLPVHPWQLRESLPKTYSQEWANGRIREVSRPPLRARLTTSLRTVVPDDPSFPILKLSIGSLMTSTERSMSPHTVMQGPIYSQYLRRVFQDNPSWTEHVEMMQETGGLCWAAVGDSRERSRHLSLLFRQRLQEPEGLTAVSCSSLPQPTGTGLSSTHLREFFARGEGPLTNFERYCRLLIPFHLNLFLESGLALEAHLQNCVVLWSLEDGPQRLWIRDWGGLRADSQRLKERAADLHLQLDPRSLTLTDGESARKKLIACLYSNHLTEIVVGLSRSFGFAEERLWQIVAEHSKLGLAPWAGHPLKEEVLLNPWPIKTLLAPRLEARIPDYHHLPNPLLRV